MKVEQTPDTKMKFSLRVKQNLLLFVTALVMCFVYEVRHDRTTPWAEGIGAFFASWLLGYLVLILVLLLVGGISAATGGFFFGDQNQRTLGGATHQIIIYGCLTVLAVSLFLFIFR